jgi:hypothetical protein
MSRRIIIWIAPLLLLLSCNSDPVFPVEPHIEFVDIQPAEVRQFRDSIVITLRFTDGDGDLGDDGSGDKNLVVKDNRTQFPDSLTTIYYTLPNLSPNAKNPSIQGNIIITVAPTIITPGQSSDQTDFTIYLYDRADNKSNVVITDPISIIP